MDFYSLLEPLQLFFKRLAGADRGEETDVVHDLDLVVVREQITSSSSQGYFRTVYSAIDILDNFPMLTSPKLYLSHRQR